MQSHIYLTNSVNYPTQNTVFEERGLKGQVAGAASDCGVIALGQEDPIFALRLASIHKEIAPYVGKDATTVTSMALLQSFPVPDLIERPLLVFESKSNEAELATFGMSEMGSGKHGTVVGRPTVEQINHIVAGGYELYTTPPAGNVNIAGYLAFLFSWRAIQAHFQFQQNLGKPLPVMLLAKTVDEMYAFIHKKKGDKDASGKPLEMDVDLSSMTVDMRTLAVQFGARNASLPADEVMIEAHTFDPAGRTGHVFPFFAEMLTADREFALNVFMTYFRNTFSDSPDQTAVLLPIIRRGFRNLATTKAGKVIQHIFFLIDSANKTGGRVVLLRDGLEYCGGIVTGTMQFLVKGKVVDGLSGGAFKEAVRACGGHRAVVEELVDLVVGKMVADDSDYVVPDKEKAATQPRYLARLLDLVSFSDTEVDLIDKKYVSKLRFMTGYWECTPENISKFLASVLAEEAMPDDYPMLVTRRTLFSKEPYVRQLAVFGLHAPSIYYGDKTIHIAAPLVDDPNLHKVDGKKRAVPHIPFQIKGFGAALADWNMVRRQKVFRFTAAKMSGAGTFSNVKARSGVISGPLFDTFYADLRRWVHSGNPEPILKRKRGDEEEEAEKEKGTGAVAKKVKSLNIRF